MPKSVAKTQAEYWANRKLMWHSGELGMDKAEVKELKHVQKMMHKYHPEFDCILMLKKCK